jgi:hypothetical protein
VFCTLSVSLRGKLGREATEERQSKDKYAGRWMGSEASSNSLVELLDIGNAGLEARLRDIRLACRWTVH